MVAAAPAPPQAQHLDLPCVSRSQGQEEEMGGGHLFSTLASLDRRLMRLVYSPPCPPPTL